MLFAFMVLLFLSVFGLQNLKKNIVDFALFCQLFFSISDGRPGRIHEGEPRGKGRSE
jgi:hypothetical protein